ncbi:autotransporter domain protein [Campylobacter pinnipediorum subsp. caledonicus]|uniref:autotransporter outer membrane beta-barrel domain-containing protein n=1 Tax=Campylobacter pinnipediorum TaxID=1965231 RepID=UPI0009950F66|nr:autotransporter outer membrane beta-barrel domain-containing protein [Campylobacter pinnipediorum]AQW86686.1 autotransporter domain protein [Campylobacter pinnipediorum subsp. caledonicus]
MKISMIASATIIGVMMTINAYGGSSLDEINNAQKEKSELIKKLEEASKDEFLDKFKIEKEKIEKEKIEALKPQIEVKKLEEQVKQTKQAAEKAINEVNNAEQQKNKAEQAKQQAEKQKIEAEKQKTEAEKQKTEAETTAFRDNKEIKELNKIIENDYVLKNNLQKLNSDNFKSSNKNLKEAIEVFTDYDKYDYNKLVELHSDSAGERNGEKLEILEKLSKIGLVREDNLKEYKERAKQTDTTKKKKLATELNDIIGKSYDKGLTKLLLGIGKKEAEEIKAELEAVIKARNSFKQKQTEFENKQAEFQRQEQEFKRQQNLANQKEKIITDQQKKVEKVEQELEQAKKALEQAQKQAEQKLKELQPKLEQAEKELKQAQELAKLARNPEAKAKIIAELDAKLDQAKKDRAEAISSDKNLELNKDEAQTTSSLLSVVNNKEVENLLLNVKAKDIATLAKNINSTLEEVSKEFKDNKTVDTLLSSVGSATNSRLAKLSNPLNDDLALAYAIKNLSDNKFADNADTLSSVVKEYTNRFNYDSNLWGNIMGGKAKLKSQANTNTYGFMLGYDKAFDNMIIGGYAGYTNAKSSSKTLTTKSDNYHFGAYTRMYIDQNEIDAKVSYGKGKNKLDRKVIIDPDFDANGKYDTKFFDASIDYGHIFDTNNNSFMKPMIGLEYSHVSTKGFKETGKVPVSFKGTTVKTLSAKAAVEFRKYIANGNFLYITPGIQKELRKSMKDTELAFVNSTENIKYASKKDKHTFFTLKTGAEMKLTDNLSTNINFGVKAKSESKYYNGTVGLSYKF